MSQQSLSSSAAPAGGKKLCQSCIGTCVVQHRTLKESLSCQLCTSRHSKCVMGDGCDCNCERNTSGCVHGVYFFWEYDTKPAPLVSLRFNCQNDKRECHNWLPASHLTRYVSLDTDAFPLEFHRDYKEGLVPFIDETKEFTEYFVDKKMVPESEYEREAKEASDALADGLPDTREFRVSWVRRKTGTRIPAIESIAHLLNVYADRDLSTWPGFADTYEQTTQYCCLKLICGNCLNDRPGCDVQYAHKFCGMLDFYVGAVEGNKKKKNNKRPMLDDGTEVILEQRLRPRHPRNADSSEPASAAASAAAAGLGKSGNKRQKTESEL